MSFAFDDFQRLVRNIVRSGRYPSMSPYDDMVQYACGLISELAYCHISKFELDCRKRAKVVPCDTYRLFIKRGFTTDVEKYLGAPSEGFRYFVVVDRGVVAVGVLVDTALFIGMRGTVFLFDWLINVHASLIPTGYSNVIHRCDYQQIIGRCHRGFAEEAVRISARIGKQVRKWKDQGIEITDSFLSGHSMGGAVAALSEHLLHGIGIHQTITIGSPRYCDVTAYYGETLSGRRLPIQIRRPGDIVPFFPLRLMGYADHPLEYNTTGEPFAPSDIKDRMGRYLYGAASFVFNRFKPHKMDVYRKELWKTCYGRHPEYGNGDKPIAEYERLKKEHVN